MMEVVGVVQLIVVVGISGSCDGRGGNGWWLPTVIVVDNGDGSCEDRGD